MAAVRTLHIQVQPGLVETLDIVRLRREFQAIATENPLVIAYRFVNGNDESDYYNFDFDTPSPATLWEQIVTDVYKASAFGESVRMASMAICTGHRGWEDYLLIHHWDPSEDLDEVPVV